MLLSLTFKHNNHAVHIVADKVQAIYLHNGDVHLDMNGVENTYVVAEPLSTVLNLMRLHDEARNPNR